MTENKKTIASRLKDHYTENKLAYIKFGYYTLGVVAMSATYTVLERYQMKQRAAWWDAAELEGIAAHGESTRVFTDREGNPFWFTPNPTQD